MNHSRSPGGPGTYHARLGEDVPPSSVNRCALAGVSVTEAASSHHHVVEGVVIFVLRVPPPAAQQSVAQGEETGEVHPDVGRDDQI